MTKVWKLEEAKTHFSELVREAEREPQVVTRHGKAVVVVSAVSEEELSGLGETPTHRPTSALHALRGNFDFSDMPDEDLFPRDRSSDLRELNL